MDERIKALTELNSLVVVAEENHVESYSSRGFRLLEIVHTDIVEEVEEKTTDNENGYNSSYGTKTHSVTRGVVVRKPRFVMFLDGNGSLAEKQEEIEALVSRVRELNLMLTSHKECAEDLAKREASLQQDKLRLSDTIQSLSRDLTTSREVKRKLEGDIGKIRTAIGDLRMKEIIGG